MSGKISQLPLVAAPLAADLIEVVEAGVNSRASLLTLPVSTPQSTAIAVETTRATAAETAAIATAAADATAKVATETTNRMTAVTAEASARAVADTTLTTNLASEVARATAAEAAEVTARNAAIAAAVYVKGADIARAGTTNLDAATGDLIDLTGTTTVSAFTLAAGKRVLARFTGIGDITLGGSLIGPTSAGSITTAVGDFAEIVGYGSGVVRIANYTRKDGTALVATNPFDQSLNSSDSVGFASVYALELTGIIDTSSSGGFIDTRNSGGYISTNSGGIIDTSNSGGSIDTRNSGGVISTNNSGGSIDTSNSGGFISTNSGGFIDTRNSGGYISTNSGGFINTSAGGGYIDTNNSGGSINTSSGGVGLVTSGFNPAAGWPLCYDGSNMVPTDPATLVVTGRAASVAVSAQTADITTTTLTSMVGFYRVSYVLQDTTSAVAAGAVVLTIGWTDDAGATTATATQILTATGRQSGSIVCQLASGNLTYATTHTGIYSTAQYALRVIAEKLE